MKRLEFVIETAALGRFTEIAHALNLHEFDVAEVHRTPPPHTRQRQRVYRGQSFAVDFVEQLKVDINVGDHEVNRIASSLSELVTQEPVTVLRIDYASSIDSELKIAAHNRPTMENLNSASN
jgi:nitrogen regulatory protein PII